MSKKITLIIAMFFVPYILRADIWDNSASSFYLAFYIYTVVPILIWLASLICLILTFLKKNISAGLFWTINVLNILLAILSSLPVFFDSTERSDSITGWVLVLCVLIPSYISIQAISLRQNQIEKQKNIQAEKSESESA